MLTNTDSIEIKFAEFQMCLEEISQKIASMVKENARTVQDQLKFARKYDALTKEHEEIKYEYDRLSEKSLQD